MDISSYFLNNYKQGYRKTAFQNIVVIFCKSNFEIDFKTFASSQGRLNKYDKYITTKQDRLKINRTIMLIIFD